jgi:hypothetical protein
MMVPALCVTTPKERTGQDDFYSPKRNRKKLANQRKVIPG